MTWACRALHTIQHVIQSMRHGSPFHLKWRSAGHCSVCPYPPVKQSCDLSEWSNLWRTIFNNHPPQPPNKQVAMNKCVYVTNCKIYPTISHVYLFSIYRLFVQNKFRFGWFHIRSSSALVRSSTSSNYLHSEICQSGWALQRHHLLQICEVQPLAGRCGA